MEVAHHAKMRGPGQLTYAALRDVCQEAVEHDVPPGAAVETKVLYGQRDQIEAWEVTFQW